MSGSGRWITGALAIAILAGCSPRERSTEELSAMSASELQAHWEAIDGGLPAPSWAYRDRVRRAGVARVGADWPEMERLWVLERKIWEGMSAEQLLWSWGAPEHRYADTYPVGTYEHWYWNLNVHTGGSEATLHDGRVIWYRVGDQ